MANGLAFISVIAWKTKLSGRSNSPSTLSFLLIMSKVNLIDRTDWFAGKLSYCQHFAFKILAKIEKSASTLSREKLMLKIEMFLWNIPARLNGAFASPLTRTGKLLLYQGKKYCFSIVKQGSRASPSNLSTGLAHYTANTSYVI